MDRRSTTLVFAALAASALVACSVAPETSAGAPAAGGSTDATEPDPSAESGSESTAAPPAATRCDQTAYRETLPSKASLAGLSFSPTNASSYLLAALEKRYPVGKEIVEGGLSSPLADTQGNCIDRFLSDTSTASVVLRQAPTVVHECGHFFDLGERARGASAYVVRPDLRFSCKQGDTTTRGGKTFARSRLKNDSFYAKRKACGGTSKQGCDFYADVYLTGSPDDASFQGGDQGYNSVLEEANQYVNSLATALAFEETYQGSKVSERDGILTFLWYIERYLKMAREEYPEAYALLSEDACWRQATLAVWDRGWFYLDATAGSKGLGLDDAAIAALVKDPALTAEIDTLRRLDCE